MQIWDVHAFPVEALTLDFPHARSLVVLRSERTIKKTTQSTQESRYYLSSQMSEEHAGQQWIGLIRGHWAGVENRNHWRRDALLGEDRSRSRHPQLLANLALLRNVLLHLLPCDTDSPSLPQTQEQLQRNLGKCLELLRTL